MAEPTAAGSAPAAGRLADGDVEQRLARIDEALGQLELVPGRTAKLALEVVETLTEVYGEALARVIHAASDEPAMLTFLTTDELLRHLLVLHGVHPQPTAQRVAQAVADLGAAGTPVELIGISDGVAQVRLAAQGHGCGSSAPPTAMVRDHVLTAAPELDTVRLEVAAPQPTLIPAESLRRRAPAEQR